MGKPSVKASGASLIYLGIALSAISIVLIVITGVMGDHPTAGKAATLIAVGVPAGVIIITFGVIKAVRERKH